MFCLILSIIWLIVSYTSTGTCKYTPGYVILNSSHIFNSLTVVLFVRGPTQQAHSNAGLPVVLLNKFQLPITRKITTEECNSKTTFDILQFSLATRRRGHKQSKLNDHVYSFLLCPLGLTVKCYYDENHILQI